MVTGEGPICSTWYKNTRELETQPKDNQRIRAD